MAGDGEGTTDTSGGDAPPPMTLAEEERLEQGRNDPPQLGEMMQEVWRYIDHQPAWRQFRATIDPSVWPKLLVVGREAPEAKATFYPDGSVLITVTDGLIRFLQNACDALFSRATFRKKGGIKTEGTALTRKQANDLLLTTYLQWSRLKEGEMPAEHPVELGPKAARHAYFHFSYALQFVVLHEFAHAMLHRGCKHDAQLELEADRWAIDRLLAVEGRPAIEQNMTLAGAIIGIRVFAALDALGLWYLGDYPAPATRFQTIVKVFRERMPDQISYYMASTYLYTLDMQMESTENSLRRLPARPDQVLSHVVSLLAEIYHQRMTLPEAARIANRTFAKSHLRPSEILDRAMNVFASSQPSYRQEDEWGNMARFVIDNCAELQALLSR